MRNRWIGLSAGALALALASGAGAEDTERTEPREPREQRRQQVELNGEQPGSAEKRQLTKTETAGLLAVAQLASEAEVTAGRLAQERAQSESVRQYANTMVSDHQDALERVRQLARREKIDLDRAMQSPVLLAVRETHRERARELRGLRGQAFDIAYMRSQPGTHALLKNLAEQAQRSAQVEEVRRFAGAAISGLERHQRLAQEAMPEECAVPVPDSPRQRRAPPGIDAPRDLDSPREVE